MTIHLLDAALASKIAAGEVIERPASIVKELVENALDAGASQVHVEIRGGGVQLIRVTDDGRGIDEAEIELAFERHATSKLSCLADLEAIATLGFRGEALPSIRAVAEVTITSRPTGSEVAAYRHFVEGQVVEGGRRGAPPGTQVTVRNLFANVPARLRFLRSGPAEASQAVQVVVQYALAYPEVRFSVDADGRSALRTPGNGLLRDAIVAAFGRSIAEGMVPVDSGEPRDADRDVRVAGFIGKPTLSKANRTGISLFVNRRWVHSRLVAQAVETAFQNRLMVGRHPMAILHLSVPTESVDVNVHPSKSEVKLLFDREVFSVTRRTIQETLDRIQPIPAFTGLGPAFSSSAVSFEESSSNAEQLPFEVDTPGVASAPAEQVPVMRVLGQVGQTYVIAEGPDGMYLVDQHAAHERVLFEQVKDSWERGEQTRQGLLAPFTFDLSAVQIEAIEQHGDRLEALGFQVERFGESSLVVRAAPPMLDAARIGEVLIEAIDTLRANPLQWRDLIAASVACHAAVRAGKTLDGSEMVQLIRSLEATSSPRTCPHGRPTMLHLSAAQLEREFGRRG